MMLIFFLALISYVQSSSISMILPQLTKYEYTFPSQNFAIKNRQNFKYELESYGDPQVNITDINGKPATDSCSFVSSTIEHQILTQYKLPLKDKTQWTSMKTTFVVVKFQHLIYTITNSLELTAYSYSDNKIQKIATLTLLQSVDNYLDSRVFFILNGDESLLFLFSTYGVWKIQTRAILTKIQKLNIELQFVVYDATNIGERLLLSTVSHGIVVYQIRNKTLVLEGSITQHQQNRISPIDSAFDPQSGLLFVLDTRKNIYIYKMVEKLFYYFDVIQFQHSANFKIMVVGTRIYYSFLEGMNMEIAQLQYNQSSRSAELIRYYKEFDYVYDFIATKNELFVLSHETLDVYNAFIDPRLIANAHGIRLPISSRKFQHIISDIYLFSSHESLKLIKLKSNKAHILCNFRKVKQSININFKSNMSDCSAFSITSPKTSYNSYCEVAKNINIEINIPEEIERQKILMYAVVIMVIMFFFAGLICLVQWRNGRLDIIDKLADEIRRYKDKEKRTRQFIQQNDIEVPRSAVFSSHQSEI